MSEDEEDEDDTNVNESLDHDDNNGIEAFQETEFKQCDKDSDNQVCMG